jgi:hypothetical protein
MVSPAYGPDPSPDRQGAVSFEIPENMADQASVPPSIEKA